MRYVLILMMGLFAVACGQTPERPPPADVPAEVLALGQQVYRMHCQSCHPDGRAGVGPRLDGRPMPEPIIRHRIRNGMGGMPAFGPTIIDEDELDALTAYVISLRSRS